MVADSNHPTARLMVCSAGDLSAGAVLQIAHGGQVTLHPELLHHIATRRAEALRRLASDKPVYGVSTGMGKLSSVRLSAEEQAQHQHNLFLARAVGGEPWLTHVEVRALFAVRLATFLHGDAGVSAELCECLVNWLAIDALPDVPRAQAGSAGEIIPLSHAFGPLAGVGTVPRGAPVPFQLGPKEGIALLQGVPQATALGLLWAERAQMRAGQLLQTAALAIAAVGAPHTPYAAELARGDEVLGRVLADLRLAAGPKQHPRLLQAPISFRVAGVALAHLQRSITRLHEAAQRALAGVTDSPALVDGEFLGTAGFHGIELAAAADGLVAALTQAAEVSVARAHRMLDPQVTGLPAQLAAAPGPQTGMVTVHKRAVGALHALRRLAAPAGIGTIETSGGQEDVQSFAVDAMDNLREADVLVRVITACEALIGYQAWLLNGAEHLPGCMLLSTLRSTVGSIDGDRPFGADISQIMAVLG
jgi:histidine ammonia-lyase